MWTLFVIDCSAGELGNTIVDLLIGPCIIPTTLHAAIKQLATLLLELFILLLLLRALRVIRLVLGIICTRGISLQVNSFCLWG
jgi:hypothetical protein